MNKQITLFKRERRATLKITHDHIQTFYKHHVHVHMDKELTDKLHEEETWWPVTGTKKKKVPKGRPLPEPTDVSWFFV